MSLLRQLKLIWRVSRPRDWMSLFAPYALGVLVGLPAKALEEPFTLGMVIAFAIYFLLPANLLAYGLNDISDYELDHRNARKIASNGVLPQDQHRRLTRWIILITIPFLLTSFFLNGWALGSFLLFLFLTIFYSIEPIRAKNKPILDSLFNALYIVPGIFGYYLAGGQNMRWPAAFAAILWAMAMHAYSAVPSIPIDKELGTRTIATLFGKKITLIICLALYLAAAILAALFLGNIARTLGVAYAALVVISIQQKNTSDLLSIHDWFSLFNVITGITIFLILLTERLG